MKLECRIRIEDHVYPQHSLKRSVNCNLFVGVWKKSNIQTPRLYMRTASNTYQYEIKNNIECIRGIKEKNVLTEMATVGFLTPKHYLMIEHNERGKLVNLLKLLRKLSDGNKLEPNDITIMTDLKKPISKPRIVNARSSTFLKEISNISEPVITELRLQYPILWNVLMKDLRKLEMKDFKRIKFPVLLGQLPLVCVSLTNMELRNDDLLWLGEQQVRGSLTSLCLSKNKLTEFPMAVIDCLSLKSLDLSCNTVGYIPHGIRRLQKLENLQLSNNLLHYLPADITSLKLQCIDLTMNCLYSNVPVGLNHEDGSFRGRLRLEDWAAMNVDARLRYRLTAADCPNNLLRKLRSLSRCICEKNSLRHPSTEYYVPFKKIRFSATSWLSPQRACPHGCSHSLFLQYHFCTYQSRCEDRKFNKANCFRLVEIKS